MSRNGRHVAMATPSKIYRARHHDPGMGMIEQYGRFVSPSGLYTTCRPVMSRSAGTDDSSSPQANASASPDAVVTPLIDGQDSGSTVSQNMDVDKQEVIEVEAVDAQDSEEGDEVGVVEGQSLGVFAKGREFVGSNPIAGYSLLGVLGFLTVTFVLAVIKSTAKGFTKQGKRTRTVQKNKLVIDELNAYLPDNRETLRGSSITSIRLRTGFTPTEIFRKYLWYLLRERTFDNEALADLIELKSCLGLSDVEVADALKERASRIFEKFGTVMLDTSGMSPAGVERKATSRALFSKMLYLVECDDVLASEYRSQVDLRDIFGATEDDVGRLRIASLYEVDFDALMNGPEASKDNADTSDA